MFEKLIEKETIQGKTILITGASSGIGKKLAIELAKYKPVLILIARRTEKLMKTALEVKKQDADVLPIVGDVRREKDRENLIGTAVEKYGRIDILVNNAGLGKVHRFIDQPEEEIDQLIETNLTAVIKLTQKVAKIMKIQERGHIINVSSVLGELSPAPFAVYSTTKAAVKMFGEAIEEEMKEYGIRISTVYPALHDTEFCKVANVREDAAKSYDTQVLVEKIVELIKKPKKRLVVPWFYGIMMKITKYVPGMEKMVSRQIAKQAEAGKIDQKSKRRQKEQKEQKQEKLLVAR